ncbi:hypothetical protein MJT46_020153, partial [Ovis ammon polii x Ovis aries]
MMSRNILAASTCKMTEPFNFEKNESKLPSHESLRSPGGHPNHPNFRLKSPENGNKKNNFLLCEQTKQFLASQEDSSLSSHPNGVNGEMAGSKEDRKTLPTGEYKLQPSNHVPPAESKKVHKLVENSLSINNPALFNSLGPPLRSTTCHRCGLFGSLRCSQCKQTYYCSSVCQRRDWAAHKIVCRPVQQNNSLMWFFFFSNQSDCPLRVTKERAVCADKIMFSDLRSQQLRKTMEIKVFAVHFHRGTVTEFKHPGDFYVQLYSSEALDYMNRLSASLKETYANKAHEEEYVPVKGEICVAKYTVDQTWNRVIIQDVDLLQKVAQVLYIDYGNEEIIPINRIHQLTRKIDLFPPCAIRCFVASVIPAEGNWSNDCIRTIKSLLMEQYCSLKIVDILKKEEGVTFAVDVMMTSSGKFLDHVLIEMGYGLKPKGQNSKKQSTDSSDLEDVRRMMAENKIVVDRSDLIPKVLTLNVGDEFCGVVAHVQTPEDFFCQQLQSGRKLAELQRSLGEYCSQVPPRSDFYPTIGDICCAQFSEDDQWYRASVLAYASEESVLVGYVDYGNFEILSLTRLCPITPKLLELPMQAIKCVLAGVKPSLGIWTPEAVCLMKKIVQNKIITVNVVDKLENSSLVELIDRSVTPHISVTKVLLSAGFAVEDKGLVTDKPSDVKEAIPLGVETKVNPLVWTWVELAVDQTVDVVVCVIDSPGEFYCHVLKGDDALKELNDLNNLLAEYCQQKLPNDFKAEIGQPCCAFFVGKLHNWYRALVKEILPNGNFKVHFVDYGNVEEVTADELRMIPSRFLKLPFQGIRCWLVGIQPRNKHWSKEAIARFQTCVARMKLQAQVVEITENGVGIELTDLSTSYPRIISDILIDEHLVLKAGSPHTDLAKTRPVDKHDLQIDTPGLQAISSADQWSTIELPVNKTVQACILEITNPNLFYALPNEIAGKKEKLSVLTAELLEYCNAQKSRSPYIPKIGDACCARYTSDDCWYRAIVLGTSDADVKVLYADYGNIETLPLCRVQPISASHLELPFQIIKCSLDGLMELNGRCSHLMIELLKNFMLNQNVMISVKGVIKNVHTVSVEKCSENGTINIADKLVMYGLAKNITSKKPTALNTGIIEKHEQILLFLLNNPTNQNKFIEMKKLLK